MTRQIFLRLLLIALLTSPITNYNNRASAKGVKNTKKQIAVTANVNKTGDIGVPLQPVNHPVTPGLKPPVHKMYVPMMEELAKIHRFHRERLGKVKKHHKQCWISAKLLLILCHAALLICAYLHSTH